MNLFKQQQQAFDLLCEFASQEQGGVFILRGYAGTGKTTLVKAFVDYLKTNNMPEPQLMAPTGRAAKILTEKVNVQATTIHRCIYSYEYTDVKSENNIEGAPVALKFIYPIKNNQSNALCIVDEASMISSKVNHHELYRFGTNILLNDLITYARPHFGGKIIFIGDDAQLPPVGDNISYALDAEYFRSIGLDVTEAQLTDVLRQDNTNAIFQNSINIRQLLLQQQRNRLDIVVRDGEVENISSENVAKQYSQMLNNNKQVKLICYSNKSASLYNKAIRQLLFPGQTAIQQGDVLQVIHNYYSENIDVFNGSFVTVEWVGDTIEKQSAPILTEHDGKKMRIIVTLEYRKVIVRTDDDKTLKCYIIESLLNNNAPQLSVDEILAMYINFCMRNSALKNNSIEFNRAIKEDVYYNALWVKYGYAITGHKSQGGEWDYVFADFDGRNRLNTDSLRWMYTVVTRAKHTMYCLNLNNKSPFDNMKVLPISTSKVKMPIMQVDAISIATDVNCNNTPFHQAEAQPHLKAKYWQVFNNLKESGYSIQSVESKPYRERYTLTNSSSGIVEVDAIYNGKGVFTRYEVRRAANQEEILKLFTSCCTENKTTKQGEESSFELNYLPSNTVFSELFNMLQQHCEEINITIECVIEQLAQYKVLYYLKTSQGNALIEFFIDKNNNVTAVMPRADCGPNNKQLSLLIEKLI